MFQETPSFDQMAYGPIGKAVKDADPFTEADPIGVLAAVYALYSTALGGTVFQPDGRPVVVWTVLAGRSKLARKGFALATAEAILSKSIGEFLKLRRTGGQSSGPSLISTVYENEQESLTSEGGLDNRTLVVDEEWPTTLQLTARCPKYPGVLRTAWDGKAIRNVTKKDGKTVVQAVESPALGFHAHIQPRLWGQYVKDKDAAGGTYNRLLPVIVRKSKKLPKAKFKGKPLDFVAPSQPLKAAYDWAREEVRDMELSDASAKYFDALAEKYEELLEDMPEDRAAYVERADEQVMRIACVLTAAARKTVISVEAVKAAQAFVEYSVNSVLQLVAQSPAASGRTAAPLDERIRRVLRDKGPQTSSQLYRALSSRFPAAELQSMAEEMPDVETTQVRVNRPGQNPTFFRLVEPKPEPEPEPVAVPAQRRAPARKAPAKKAASTRKTPAKTAAAPAKKATAASPPAPRRKAVNKATTKKAAAPKKRTTQPVPAGN
ncbi:DUF3987 domain-containing protein [Streptomyces sp. CA-288835]|uniref:DUF3987 domain-containing protein n=1 Tax=Streptomyces sp. CA-288835 TaxID=3240069 RepID=UPI003D8DAFF2